MRRTILALLMIFCLLLAGSVSAEDAQPANEEKAGAVSMGDYLHRYPDQVISNEDGSVTEVFSGISFDAHNAFFDFLRAQKQKKTTRLFAATADFVYQDETGADLFPDLEHYELDGQNPVHYVVLKFVNGAVIYFRYDTAASEARITYPAGTYDERVRTAQEAYDNMVVLTNEGKISEAVREYRRIADPAQYAPAASLVSARSDLAAAISRYRFEVPGEYVSFGRYEQDGNKDNGPEAVEWLVLEADGGKSLLVSRYGLDRQCYNDTYQEVTWEECSLRKWLDGEFLKAAFNDSERNALAGDEAGQRVRLLTQEEALSVHCFADDESRRCVPTAYAVSKGVWVGRDGAGSCAWWLNSPGSLPSCAMRVSGDGTVRSTFVDYDEAAVRPAILIDLDSDYFKTGN